AARMGRAGSPWTSPWTRAASCWTVMSTVGNPSFPGGVPGPGGAKGDKGRRIVTPPRQGDNASFGRPARVAVAAGAHDFFIFPLQVGGGRPSVGIERRQAHCRAAYRVKRKDHVERPRRCRSVGARFC